MAFGTLGALFTLVMAGLIFATYEGGQESVVQKILATEVTGYLERRAADPSTPLPDSALIHSYVGLENLPARYRDNLDKFEAEDYDVPLLEWHEIQLWQGTTLDGEALFVVLDLGATADASIRDPNLVRLFLIWLPLLGLFAGWLGWIISKRLSDPLSRLTHTVTAYNPEQAESLVENEERDLEVDALAKAFQALQQRIGRFVEREREFTRFASHELRTPITVARGSAEILRRALKEPNPKVDRALSGLEQAAREMATTVDLFLWLAREEAQPRIEAVCETAEILQGLISTHRPLLAGRNVQVVTDFQTERHEELPADLFRIAASNLIRNAFQYTLEGEVTLILEADRLVVRDTGQGMPEELLRQVRRPLVRGPSGEGTGLGVSIIDRIAGRCGWTLQIDSELGRGTCSTLRFSKAPIH